MSDKVVGLTQGVPVAPTEGATVVPPEQSAQMSSQDNKYFICDQQFMGDLRQLKALRSYMIRQAKSTEAGTIELDDLNSFRFREPEKGGRWPTREEWSHLEDRSNKLYR